MWPKLMWDVLDFMDGRRRRKERDARRRDLERRACAILSDGQLTALAFAPTTTQLALKSLADSAEVANWALGRSKARPS